MKRKTKYVITYKERELLIISISFFNITVTFMAANFWRCFAFFHNSNFGGHKFIFLRWWLFCLFCTGQKSMASKTVILTFVSAKRCNCTRPKLARITDSIKVEHNSKSFMRNLL